jgi:hypothetical protein
VITIESFNFDQEEKLYKTPLQVDEKDTVLDLKFLFAEKKNVPAEYVNLFYRFPNKPSR